MNFLNSQHQEQIWNSIPNNNCEWGSAVLPFTLIHVQEFHPASDAGKALVKIQEDSISRKEMKAEERSSSTIKAGMLELLEKDGLIEKSSGTWALTDIGKVVLEFLDRSYRMMRARSPYAMPGT